ncbi:MAG TPA: phosphate acyltransferase PlsX [Chromatiales bacterium]|nr:phosphate acyltransferase PlsX [Chromatiales bacterium]
MSRRVTVSVDAMGGDVGPGVTVPAACDIARTHPHLDLLLVGDAARIHRELEAQGARHIKQIQVHHASQVVGMDEPPAQALRSKKDSSMRVAIDLVRAGTADAAVSAGNTGALMATGRFVLKTLPGIDRPAIMTALPSRNGHTHMLDLGANVDCKAEHLLQFAVMGSVLVEHMSGLRRPRVGLLNVGQEAIKGNEQVKEANALLERSPLNYIGYVEGDHIYCGDVDVVVSDGFVGNVSLKSSEGVAKLITQLLKEGFRRNLLTRAAALVATPVLRNVLDQVDPRRYNGASLVGLRGVVVKSHGGADRMAFANAIHIAGLEAAARVPERIAESVHELLRHGSAA